MFGMALLRARGSHVHSYKDCQYLFYSRKEESRELSKLVIHRIEYRIIYDDGQDNEINNG